MITSFTFKTPHYLYPVTQTVSEMPTIGNRTRDIATDLFDTPFGMPKAERSRRYLTTD